MPSDSVGDVSSEHTVDHRQASEQTFKYTKDRCNVWDDIPMNESQLRIGKAKLVVFFGPGFF